MNISINTTAFYDKPASTPVSAEDIAQELMDAKLVEQRAITRRRELEERLAACFDKVEDSSFTERVGDFKVNVSYPMNRKIDLTVLDAISADALPEALRPIKTVRELDIKKMRTLREAHPDMYRLFSAAMTATPGKVAVKVERIDE